MQLNVSAGPVLSLADQDLARCEAVIQRGLSSFVAVGRALATIRDRRLYRQVAPTFEAYVQQQWPDLGGRNYTNRVISAAQTVDRLVPMGTKLPVTERQARPLTPLDPEDQVEAWQRVIEASGDRPITAALVERVVQEIEAETAARREPSVPAPVPEPTDPETEPQAGPAPEPDETEAVDEAAIPDEPPLLAVQEAREDPPRIAALYMVEDWEALAAPDRRWIVQHAPVDRNTRFNRTNDNIDWAKWSWNPVTGCNHGCNYCYARDIAARFYTELAEADRFAPVFRPGRLHAPRHMRVPPAYDPLDMATIGEKNVFTGSMTDLFGKWVPQDWIDAVFAEVVRARDWNFLFLTKFPQRLAEQHWPQNAWVGASVDRQARVATAERAFRGVAAGVKWLSCEPMLERLTFSDLSMFDWVVIGAASESSQTAEFQPPYEWIKHLRDQADAAGCRVYEKPNLKNVRRQEYPRGVF